MVLPLIDGRRKILMFLFAVVDLVHLIICFI
jgi:hypothetical protein